LNIFSEAKPSDEDEEFEREMEEREREEQAKNKSNIFIKWGRFLNLLLDISVQGVKS